MIKIIIPGDISVSLNIILDFAKTHWSKYYKMQQDVVNLIYYHLKAQKVKPVVEKYPVKIEFTWYMANKRRDCDNLASNKKFILDALVKAGVLRNDGWEETSGGFEDHFAIDKVSPRIEISINSI